MALNIYALCAYYFHPTYDNDKLPSSHKKMINAFLFKHLSGEEIEEWDTFITRQGILLVNMQTQYSLTVLSLSLCLGTFFCTKKTLPIHWYFREWQNWIVLC